jgi:hypothetical protein
LFSERGHAVAARSLKVIRENDRHSRACGAGSNIISSG